MPKIEWVELGLSEYWKPKENDDELTGEVVGSKDDPKFGTQYSIKQEDGKIVITPAHAVLQMRMTGVKIGDYVRIIFSGIKAADKKGMNDLRLYRVYAAKKV